jgi:hypothetical protein
MSVIIIYQRITNPFLKQRHDNVIYMLCIFSGTVTKKRGSEITQCSDCLHDPKLPCILDLLHEVHTFEITQHTDSLLTLTDVHCKTRDIQALCFDVTTAQNSHHASPASPHSHKYQPRKFFHHKLYTLPESTSMIPIKSSQNIRSSMLSSLSLSLESLYSSLASYQAQRKILAFNQALLPLTEQPTYHLLPSSFMSASLLFCSSRCSQRKSFSYQTS